jgi:hypothetical protein
LRDRNIANVIEVRLENCHYKLQRIRPLDTPFSAAPTTNPESGFQFSLPCGRLKHAESSVERKSSSNKRIHIFHVKFMSVAAERLM